MNRYVPPVLSALAVMLLVAGYAAFLLLVIAEIQVVMAIKVVISAVALLVIGGISAALIARIRELKGGQEDDLGQY